MMNILSRKPVTEPEITGTQALRQHLRARTSGPSATPFARIAADISDAINDAASKVSANDTARRMAPVGASEVTIRAISSSLLATLTVTGTAVSAQQLEQFATNDSYDLSAEVKDQIARFLHAGHVVFNAETDRLESAYRHEPNVMSGIPPQWRHPNPTIAAAQDACKAAMAAARAPAPHRSPVPPLAPSLVASTKPRPGWA
ncbi:hypothetical protein QIH96_05305 [Bradyrhizobium japonicum]|uniref:hypothetical protein n=1 Tax=Bradyrhizobium japonicum TaxID=375 RepID=UPI002714E31B|nr:hypothetical protein [Bradyrhizobium japonicum]WLB64663.1 hypothetical protein QIH96_05305 [Bradyrhizobium japonicum]